MIGADLRELDDLEFKLKAAGFDFRSVSEPSDSALTRTECLSGSLPTLCISECVLVYMKPEHSAVSFTTPLLFSLSAAHLLSHRIAAG